MSDPWTSIPFDDEDSTRVDRSVQKKRKLNTVKCDRCRIDKQRCDPEDRIWPAKCDRCVAKHLPCSQGRRAERITRNDFEPERESDAADESNIDPEVSESVKHWMFLFRYRKNLSLLASRFGELLVDMTEPFTIPQYPSISSGQDLPAYLRGTVESELAKATETLMDSDIPRSLPGTLLPMFLEDERARDTIVKNCICRTGAQDPFLQAFTKSKDVFGEFLTLQGLILKHINIPGGIISCQTRNDCVKKALNRYCNVAAASLHLAREVFEKLGKHEAAAISQEVGLYHPKEIGYHLFQFLGGGEPPVFLQQNTLHQWLDSSSALAPLEHLERLQHDSPDINKQDLLGRTPLHIACLRGLDTVVGVLLGRGAEVHARTLFGHTALHIAASRGNKSICERILEYSDRSQIESGDSNGRTARDYAKHHDIKQLLDIRAGRSDTIEQFAAGMEETRPNINGTPGDPAVGSITAGGRFLCNAKLCYQITFARQADFRRHWENNHMAAKREYFCIVEGCTRSEKPARGGKRRGFGSRRDKMEEHIRTVHKEGASSSTTTTINNNHVIDPGDAFSPVFFTTTTIPGGMSADDNTLHGYEMTAPSSAYSRISLRSVLAHGAL